jgi:hypothetical protein
LLSSLPASNTTPQCILTSRECTRTLLSLLRASNATPQYVLIRERWHPGFVVIVTGLEYYPPIHTTPQSKRRKTEGVPAVFCRRRSATSGAERLTGRKYLTVAKRTPLWGPYLGRILQWSYPFLTASCNETLGAAKRLTRRKYSRCGVFCREEANQSAEEAPLSGL